jgi:glyoxylase-like metal-dependent hydrolase (beta-lactamase superfamily II)
VKELADGVWQLRGFPPNAINIYVLDDVLVDAGTKFAHRRILRQLRGHALSAHALTHAHPDHQGSSHHMCETLGIPLWCPAGDVEAMEDGDILGRMPDSVLNRINDRLMTGPPHKVSRPLHEGDEVGGFTVLDVPGHSAGQVAYWRESDRTLICGDVLNNMNLFTGIPGLHEPPVSFTADPARNRESARRLAELKPALACFGHGPPLRDTSRFVGFVRELPA